ncbi:GNAT family N-acetyltransferase [Nocardia sp. NEAU-351]|uniref:GNAT family N-acetyltransferase n=2 Tax=Nocardia bovistercoris TaxID=2785916 RepID=A0A931IC84_9NOCA|nr:GNAT family N-acetyltransferase [Nocardia bovistercoris]MBH0777765.1 GNAT family N-acetyltransferase [Nocardia bovistercoris]
MPDTTNLTFRTPTEDDHARVLAVVGDWWGGLGGDAGARQRAALLPRLFFQHFTDTSIVVEERGELVGFLIGFLSQSRPDEAYIHFVGVSPDLHGRGLGRELYRRFFDTARRHGRKVVRAITSDTNTGSQAFHARMGFTVSSATYPDYDGAGMTRVTFERVLD